MRMLHCVPSMIGGGAERQLTYLVAELVEAGCDVHVALVHGGPNIDRLIASRATIHWLRAFGNHDPQLLMRLLLLIKTVRPDVVHCWLLQMETLGGLAAALTGTPWVFSERSSEGCYPPTWKNRLRIRVAKFANAIVSNSEAGDRYWQPRVGSGVRRFMIPNGLPLDEIAAAEPARDNHTAPGPDVPIILSAGRIDEGKNLSTFVHAVSLLAAERSIHAVCCGDGPLRPLIEQLIEDRGLTGRMVLPGYVPNLWSWMKRAHVLVSTSRFEGRPNVLLEAMACGCPLVVSDISAHREILDDRSALFVNPDDPEDVAGAIRSVLDNPSAAEQRAIVARGRVAHFSTGATARMYMDVYREIAERDTPSRAQVAL